MKNTKVFLFGLGSGILATVFVVFIILAARFVTENSKDSYDSFEDKIEDISEIIEENYYQDYEEEELFEAAYEGYVSGLGDTYSSYFSEEDFAALMEHTSGSYEGIGVVISYSEEGEDVVVVAPFEGSPGEAAGILPGDIITNVDGTDIKGMTLEEVVTHIKGEKGTKVTVTVYRETTEEILDLVVERDVIDYITVSHEMLEDNIGYISISGFQEVTYNQFMEAYNDLEANGQKGMIIDLRNNPGGLVSSVNAIADEILPEGLIVYTEDKNGNRRELYSDGEKSFDKPLVILVNENSASASEILSGAVKDHGVGKIVGTTTFGKGLVQNLISLDDGSAVKVTISKYYTPAGNYIHGIGIEPDVVIEIPEELQEQYYIEREDDVQFDKAVEVIKDMM